MIVLDTTVLVYAAGVPHPLQEPSRALLVAVRDGRLRATTTVQVIQEFAYVHARRGRRDAAVTRARAYAVGLAPLLASEPADLDRGLTLFARHEQLGPFDAVLAATAIRVGAEALVSADRGFAGVRGLRFVELGGPRLPELLAPGA